MDAGMHQTTGWWTPRTPALIQHTPPFSPASAATTPPCSPPSPHPLRHKNTVADPQAPPLPHTHPPCHSHPIPPQLVELHLHATPELRAQTSALLDRLNTTEPLGQDSIAELAADLMDILSGFHDHALKVWESKCPPPPPPTTQHCPATHKPRPLTRSLGQTSGASPTQPASATPAGPLSKPRPPNRNSHHTSGTKGPSSAMPRPPLLGRTAQTTPRESNSAADRKSHPFSKPQTANITNAWKPGKTRLSTLTGNNTTKESKWPPASSLEPETSLARHSPDGTRTHK